MKISKRQLRRIIKEEKAKLLRESITDMATYQDMFERVALEVSDKFYNDMMKLYEEEPDTLFVGQRGAIEKDVWEQNVVYAQQEIDTVIAEAMRSALERIETNLHDGRYFDKRGR